MIKELKQSHSFFRLLILECVCTSSPYNCFYYNLLCLTYMGRNLASYFFSHFLIIEYKFFCSHCPHYINSDSVTKCMFLLGIPKIFSPKPGPFSSFEKVMTLIGFAIMFGFPLYWLIKIQLMFFLYCLSGGIFIMTMYKYECVYYIYFHCPANRAK